MIPTYYLIRTEINLTRIEMHCCPFCNQDLEVDGSWIVCEPCGVDFVFHDSTGFHIKFDRTIGKYKAALNLYPEANITLLTAFDVEASDNDPDNGYSQIKITYCMTNVTPNNVLDKMKLLMVWQ